MLDLLDSALFIPLANLVAKRGIRYFVEPHAGGDFSGMEAAKRLNLHGFACDTGNAAILSQRYLDFDVYDGDSLSFLTDVLPKLDGPAFFWLDAASPTFAQEEAMIQDASQKASLLDDWFIDVKR